LPDKREKIKRKHPQNRKIEFELKIIAFLGTGAEVKQIMAQMMKLLPLKV